MGVNRIGKLCSTSVGTAVILFLAGIFYLLMRVHKNGTVAPVSNSPHRIYSAARKPRGGSGTVSTGARRALPLKRRSG